jgi:hypothetical protein
MFAWPSERCAVHLHCSSVSRLAQEPATTGCTAYLDLAPGAMDAADAAAVEQAKPRIEFPEQEEAEREQTRLEAERAKHKARFAPVRG